MTKTFDRKQQPRPLVLADPDWSAQPCGNNIAWEADYPHSDSMWPGSSEELWEVLTANDVPDDDINKMTYENAMRWYSFDPFTHITREQAVVRALRKAAEGHDVSIQALSHYKKGERDDKAFMQMSNVES